MNFWQTAVNDTVSICQVSSVQLVTNKTALKRPDRSKQRHCLQFAQNTFFVFDKFVVCRD